MVQLIERRVGALLTEYLGGFRVVVINGARQSGKSTLLAQIQTASGGTLVTLDDREVLRSARTDPRGFVTGHNFPLFIDEVQRGGEPLVLAIKADTDRHPFEYGRFILAGSSRFLTVPNLTESLAGRAAILDVWPLSQSEMFGGSDRLLDMLFGPTEVLRRLDVASFTRADIAERIVRGGFPAVHNLSSSRLRTAWFDSYLRTLIDRDLTEYRRPSRTVDVMRLAQLVLGRTAQEVNASNIASDLGVTGDTVKDYLALTETIYLHHQLPAWTGGHTGRVVKRPKLHAVDTGLAAHVLNQSANLLSIPTTAIFGALFETFVVNELAKQRTWCDTPVRFYHYRDGSNQEIDLVIEARDGSVVCVEIKAALDVDEGDFRHLIAMRDRLGDRFINGVVIHLGSRPLPFGDRITSLPVSAVWSA